VPAWVNRHVVGARVWLTFITVAELAKWAEVRSWGEPARRRHDLWIARRPVIPYDPEVGARVGTACGQGPTAWSATAAERHVGGSVLRAPRASAPHAQRQGLPGLRPARGIGLADRARLTRRRGRAYAATHRWRGSVGAIVQPRTCRPARTAHSLIGRERRYSAWPSPGGPRRPPTSDAGFSRDRRRPGLKADPGHRL
jgi:hypothetical protein